MYNEQQKCLYIDNYLSMSKVKNKELRRASMRNFFDRVEKVELEFGKDFAMLNYEEIKIALLTLCRRSIKYQKSVLSELRRYVEWCIDNNVALDYENRLIGITPQDIDVTASYKICMFKDEAELNLALNTVLPSLHEDTSYNRARAIIHLLFCGVPYDEIFQLERNQIDIERQIIYAQGRDIAFSTMCRNILEYVMGMSEFIAVPKVGEQDFNSEDSCGGQSIGARSQVTRRYSIVHTGHLIENSNGNRDSIIMTFAPVISNIFNAIKQAKGAALPTTSSDVVLSGIFSRIFEGEKRGIIDFTEYLITTEGKNIDEVERAAAIKNGEITYTNWKAAFGLSARE